MIRRTFSIYAAAFILLLSFSFVANAGHTVNIVAGSTPLTDLPWYWNSAIGAWDGGNRMFKPTHAALLFRDGEPIYNDCIYFNRQFLPGQIQACNRETFFAALDWAHWQGSLDILRPPSGDNGLREEGNRGDWVDLPYDPTPPPDFPRYDFPRDRELGPNDALNVFILGGVGSDAQGRFWRIIDPDVEFIYFADLAESLWAAAGEAQLRVYAQISRGFYLYEELEAQRQGRPLFCMWATESYANYLTDSLDAEGNNKPEENVCMEVDHLEWWLDRVACHWESAFARFPGDWDHFVGLQIDGIFGPTDGRVYLSEASAYDTSLNSYRSSVHGQWTMTPGFVLAGAEDILLYHVYARPEFNANCYQLTTPPQGCGGGNWYYLSWNGDPARQYGIYYMPPSTSFPLLELYGSGQTTGTNRPPCVGEYTNVEVPNWTYMTSEFDTSVSVPQYAPDVGSFDGEFLFPDDGYIMMVDLETGLSSEPIDLSAQLAPPPPEPPSSPTVSVTSSPNPFNPTTQISFSVSMDGLVKVVVYDLLGRQVAVLFDGVTSQGIYKATFDGSNLASGLYFVHISSGQANAISKIYLLK